MFNQGARQVVPPLPFLDSFLIDSMTVHEWEVAMEGYDYKPPCSAK